MTRDRVGRTYIKRLSASAKMHLIKIGFSSSPILPATSPLWSPLAATTPLAASNNPTVNDGVSLYKQKIRVLHVRYYDHVVIYVVQFN